MNANQHIPAVSVIMPAYNEGGHIYGNIAETRTALLESGMDVEIVAVDDGSSDNTRAEIRRAARDFPEVRAAWNSYNMGKGRALRTGFEVSAGNIVVFLDADLDLHPSQVRDIVGELERGPWDVVVTSKHHPRSSLNYPFSRTVMSWTYYIAIKILFGLPVRDTQTGLKVFRRRVLDTVFHRLLVKKFAYDVELLATAVRFGYRVHEVPVMLDFRRRLTWGRIRLKDILRVAIDTIAIFYRLRLLKYYDLELPHPPRRIPSVLVVLRDCSAVGEVVSRLGARPGVTVGCVTNDAGDAGGLPPGVVSFPSLEMTVEWLKTEGIGIELVGFLGRGCLPEGAWIRDASRNFIEPGVFAACGPVVPAPSDSLGETVAGHLASHHLTAGPAFYLHAPRPVRTVRAGSRDNFFLRREVWIAPFREHLALSLDQRRVYDITPGNTRLRYDPNLSVTGPVAPIFVPYLKTAARDSFRKGRGTIPLRLRIERFWEAVPASAVLTVVAGWLVLPWAWFGYLVLAAGLVVLWAGIATLDPLAAPLVSLGFILEYVVRAVAYPAGLLARITGKGR